MWFTTLDADLARGKLRQAGIHLVPERLTIERRDGRWSIPLPENRIAWFGASPEGESVLARERRVLRMLEARCGFAAPRLIFENISEGFDVRRIVVGDVVPQTLYERLRDDDDIARLYGQSLGRILAELHTAIKAEDVADWLPSKPGWPESREWILERLPRVIDDASLVAQATSLIDRYEDLSIATSDRVLAHSDLGPHNVAIDAKFGVNGVFDFEGAAWADRHHDFRYLVFDFTPHAVLDAALSVYEPATGRTIDRGRVMLLNAMCAISYLAFRDGKAPGERWCGRTLAEDLRWSSEAMARV